MPLRTAILTLQMGTGLAVSARIISGLLQQLGHTVEVHDIRDRVANFPRPDCAVFLERFDPFWSGRFNVFIPNHEWVRPEDVPLLSRFELVACKTREAMRVLAPHIAKDRLMYIGWTTIDRRRPDAEMDYDRCLHLASCSAQKGTDAVLRTWRENANLPKLTVVDWRDQSKRTEERDSFSGLACEARPDTERASQARPLNECDNLDYITRRIPNDELIALLNRTGIHICPSTTEGYGHTIHEAMACGAVLVTTDAPPMNEQTRGVAVLAKPLREGKLGLATTYTVAPSHLAAAVRKVTEMGVEGRRQLGQLARARWEENRREFVLAVENMDRIIRHRMSRASGVIDVPKRSTFGQNLFRA